MLIPIHKENISKRVKIWELYPSDVLLFRAGDIDFKLKLAFSLALVTK